MNSLRPLATILLLAAVGVFLYMKINETEPVMPADLGEWSAEAPEIGAEATLTPSAPTSLPATSITSEAPAFTPTTPLASASTAPSAAPLWSPGPTAAPAAQSPVAGASSDQSSPVARTAEASASLPAIPPLPGVDAATPGATGSADAPPFTPSPFTTPAAGNSQAANSSLAPPAMATPAPPGASTPSTPTTDSQAAGPVTPTDPVASADPVTPTPNTPSLFASARVAVQGALDRGELAQALLLLSDWYGDPSLTPEESQEVNALLGQLAGSVIYEGPPAHRLEAPYAVQAGETLEDVAKKYDVPWQLLAKINGVADPNALKAGQELKVVRGPFSAIIDVSERKMTLMLGRHYAGQFALDLDPAVSIEDGQWKVDQKLLTPAGGGFYSPPGTSTEDRSLLLANAASAGGQAAIIRGPGGADPLGGEPAGRVVRLKSPDINDVYDILSVGSRVTIRR